MFENGSQGSRALDLAILFTAANRYLFYFKILKKGGVYNGTHTLPQMNQQVDAVTTYLLKSTYRCVNVKHLE